MGLISLLLCDTHLDFYIKYGIFQHQLWDIMPLSQPRLGMLTALQEHAALS